MPIHLKLSNVEKLKFENAIVLKDVSFRYGDFSPYVLNKINLKISKGSRVGFVGATGSGKSTLIDLIMGLLDPTDGFLEIDGKRVNSTNLHCWQSNIAHVPQVIYLADATIAENIAFGIDGAVIDYELVKVVAEQAQLAKTIESLPQKYQTIVGERGIRLSGGQRQRIGIARALYKKANVIIFDEATSALDSKTELAVMNSLDALKGGLTLLIIAHRISTLKNCTEIVELSAGKINRIGAYGEIFD